MQISFVPKKNDNVKKYLKDVSESVKAAASEAASFKEAGFKAVKIKVMPWRQ